MTHPLFQVDAFTAVPFAGNPAAIVLLDAPAAPDWMQRVAAEMNLSETAFVVDPPDRTAATFGLRWFTPAAEVELCGHATLAAAHVLWDQRRVLPEQPIDFRTEHRGVLRCAPDEAGWIRMDFPADPPEPADPPDGLLERLGLADPAFIGRSRYDWLIETRTAAEVVELAPAFEALRAFETRGFIVTAAVEADDLPEALAETLANVAGDQRIDFVSRFFAPRLRVDEDPVTGSAHCVLGPYWAQRLGRAALTGYQASQRGGVVGVTHRGDRVDLAGQAVTVLAGELLA
jgi:PhzF family phenazine biosynthesis protein